MLWSTTPPIGATLFEAYTDCAETTSSTKHVNPTAMVRAAILMLDHIAEDAASERLRAALYAVYRTPRNLTPDVGGHRTTIGFANAVIGAVEDPRRAEELSWSLNSAVSYS
jgi:isocitrate dehydrogenase (NAD+)